jgi:hypothetical protein
MHTSARRTQLSRKSYTQKVVGLLQMRPDCLLPSHIKMDDGPNASAKIDFCNTNESCVWFDAGCSMFDVHTIFVMKESSMWLTNTKCCWSKKAKLGIYIPISCKHVSFKLKINVYIIILENFFLSKRKRVSESWVWMNHH